MALRSGILRGFDFGDAGNRFVLGWTPGAGLIAGIVTLISGGGWGEAMRNGLSAGGAAFLAWAITRELHPDRPGSALLAAVLAPLTVLRSDPDLLSCVVVLLIARVVAGTTGRVLRWFDVALVAGFAAPVAFRTSGSGVLTVSVSALGALLAVQDRRRLELATATVAVAALATVAWLRFEFGFDADDWLVPVAAAGLVGLVGPKIVRVGADRQGGAISPRRVRAARGFAWIAAAAATLGGLPPAAMGPVWVAMAVVGLRPR